MDLQESQSNILELLAKNEESISQLYMTYANLFPEMRNFWLDLADDEKLHATWIRILQQLSLNGELAFRSDKIDSSTVVSFSNHIKNEIAAATKTGFSIIKALSIAISIEENLIESRYFDSIETESEDMRHTLNDLDTATREHAHKIQEMLNKRRLDNPE